MLMSQSFVAIPPDPVLFQVAFDGKNGDCYDRYLCRVQESHESLHIIHQVSGFVASIYC